MARTYYIMIRGKRKNMMMAKSIVELGLNGSVSSSNHEEASTFSNDSDNKIGGRAL